MTSFPKLGENANVQVNTPGFLEQGNQWADEVPKEL